MPLKPYDHTNYPQTSSKATSAPLRAEFGAIEAGFDELALELETSITGASGSATTATTQAGIATTQAGIATTQAGIATTQAGNALTSANNAAATLATVNTVYDNFDDRYLGVKVSAPTLDNDGNALLEGSLYWDSTLHILRGYNGTIWVNLPATTAAGVPNVPSGNLAATNVQTALNELQTDIDTRILTSAKDATGGVAGLTLFKINFKNAANTFTNFLTNATTAARTWTFPDKNGTVAMTSDITGTNSGTNTGDNAVNTLYSGLVSNATHTGDVTGSTALTIANNAVTLAKMATMATTSLLGRSTAGIGNVEVLSATTVRALLNVSDGATANTGTVTSVSGAGSYGGLSLSGTVTTTGSITLSGTPTGTWPISVSGNAGTATNVSGGLGGQLLYQSGANVTAKLANGTAGQVLQSNGTTLAPTWADPSGGLTLASQVTAEAGLDNTEYMSSLRVKQSIAANIPTDTVKLTGNQTIAGIKTFSSTPILPAQSMVRLNTANGYGSTNTKIRRFTNVVTNQGTDITYADSATLGARFTINTDGVYAISFIDAATAGNFVGITLNDSQGTSNIELTTLSNVLAIATTPTSNVYLETASTTVYLPSGSVITAKTNGGASGSTTQLFTITRVA